MSVLIQDFSLFHLRYPEASSGWSARKSFLLIVNTYIVSQQCQRVPKTLRHLEGTEGPSSVLDIWKQGEEECTDFAWREHGQCLRVDQVLKLRQRHTQEVDEH